MNDPFDDFVACMQAEIDRETLADFGEKVYERWKNPLYMHAIPDADAKGRQKGACGDTISVFLKIENGRVQNAGFMTDGCGPSAVCGSYAAEMAIGKTPLEITEITGEDILEALGGLPQEHEHCAFLAAAALQAALEDYMSRR
jgi:nitrogen fixation NifU-like protein